MLFIYVSKCVEFVRTLECSSPTLSLASTSSCSATLRPLSVCTLARPLHAHTPVSALLGSHLCNGMSNQGLQLKGDLIWKHLWFRQTVLNQPHCSLFTPGEPRSAVGTVLPRWPWTEIGRAHV